MLTTVPSKKTMPEPSTVTSSTQRARAVPYCSSLTTAARSPVQLTHHRRVFGTIVEIQAHDPVLIPLRHAVRDIWLEEVVSRHVFVT
jgi:hypothetical protein